MNFIRTIIATMFLLVVGASVSSAEWMVIDVYAYTATGNPTASGEMPYRGGVACNLVPLGTRVLIDGVWYIVNDRSGTPGIIDIYMDTYEECILHGVQTKTVYFER